MSDSWIALKLDAQFDGTYLMPSVLMTSTMKSEPGTPPMRLPPGPPGGGGALGGAGGVVGGGDVRVRRQRRRRARRCLLFGLRERGGRDGGGGACGDDARQEFAAIGHGILLSPNLNLGASSGMNLARSFSIQHPRRRTWHAPTRQPPGRSKTPPPTTKTAGYSPAPRAPAWMPTPSSPTATWTRKSSS